MTRTATDATLAIVLSSLQAVATGVIDGFVSKPFLHDEVRTIARAALAP